MSIDSAMAEEFKRCREQQNSMEATLAEYGKRMNRFDGHMASISNDINATSTATEKNAIAIQAIFERQEYFGECIEKLMQIFTPLEGAFKVLGWCGRAIKWIAGIVAAIATLYAVLHGSISPPK